MQADDFDEAPDHAGRRDAIVRANLDVIGGRESTLLSSYPRSGSLWLRSMLQSALAGTHGTGRAGVNLFSPALESPRFAEHFGRGPFPVQVIKTHRRPAELGRHAGTARFIVLTRAPQDALISQFRKKMQPRSDDAAEAKGWAERQKRLERQGPGGHARARLPGWVQFHEDHLDRAAADPARWFFLSYERLGAATPEVLEALCRWLGTPVSRPVLEEAARAHARSAMTAREPEGSVRIGDGSGGAAHYDGETLALIAKTSAAVRAQLAREEARCLGPVPAQV